MRLTNAKALADLLRTTKCKVAGTAAKPAAVSPRMKAKAPVGRSELEAELQAQIEKSGLPQPEYDVAFLIGSRHRLDVCWRELRFGVEVQGSIHMARDKWKRDIKKRAESLLQGWTVLEVDRDAIYSRAAITWIEQLLRKLQERIV